MIVNSENIVFADPLISAAETLYVVYLMNTFVFMLGAKPWQTSLQACALKLIIGVELHAHAQQSNF